VSENRLGRQFLIELYDALDRTQLELGISHRLSTAADAAVDRSI
jgi:hypothetical protein